MPIAVGGTAGLARGSAWTSTARMLVLILALNAQSTQTTFVSLFSSDRSRFNPSFSFCWKHRPAMVPEASVGKDCQWAHLAGEKDLCLRWWQGINSFLYIREKKFFPR